MNVAELDKFNKHDSEIFIPEILSWIPSDYIIYNN